MFFLRGIPFPASAPVRGAPHSIPLSQSCFPRSTPLSSVHFLLTSLLGISADPPNTACSRCFILSSTSELLRFLFFLALLFLVHDVTIYPVTYSRITEINFFSSPLIANWSPGFVCSAPQVCLRFSSSLSLIHAVLVCHEEYHKLGGLNDRHLFS